MSQTELVRDPGWADGLALTESISEAVVELCAASFTPVLVAEGAWGELTDGPIAFETDSQEGFTATIERLPRRRLVVLTSVNQTTAGVTCQRFFRNTAPLTGRVRGGV